jgi:hypothetical protein
MPYATTSGSASPGLGLWTDPAWTLACTPKPKWPATGLKTAEAIGNRHPAVEALFDEPRLHLAVTAMLGGRDFDASIFKRPQILFTLPNAETWTVPTHWHADVPRLASSRRPGLQIFTFVEPVEPRGGGTLVVAGSHRLLNEGRSIKVRDFKPLLSREAFFRELFSESAALDDRARLLGSKAMVGDVQLEVIELTGNPGDAWFMDLRILHTAAPNATNRPRVMATHRLIPTDAVTELADAFGWAGNRV